MEVEAKAIARNLTAGQWLVLTGPRRFGNRGGPEAHIILALKLVKSGRAEWPLTPLGKAVIAARPTMGRSELAERAKQAFDRNSARREKATVAELRKLSDPWDDAVAAVYSEVEAIVRAQVVSASADGEKG